MKATVQMMNESDATRLWQKLFGGQEITAQSFAKAETLLEELNPESPLRLRFSTELAEIRKLQQG